MLTSTQRSFERFIKKQTPEKLLSLKAKYDDQYFNNSTDENNEAAPIEDWRYDILVDELRRHRPNLNVGARIRDGDNESQLPCWLGSLSKIKYDNKDFDKKLSRFVDKHKLMCDHAVISDKLDGVSCLLQTGVLGECSIYTRGNGVNGKNITHLLPFVNNIPTNIPPNMLVRGELVIPRYMQRRLNMRETTLRNTVSGIVNAKTIRDGLDCIDFIAYELISKDTTADINLSSQLHFLKSIGFRVVQHSRVKMTDLSKQHLSSRLNTRRTRAMYDIDGIVVAVDLSHSRVPGKNPSHMFAFKQDDVHKAVVKSVRWSVSKSRLLKPRVELEPIVIGGVNIRFASGYNARFIVDNMIGKGARVLVTRSGEVVPKIVDVTQPSKSADVPTSHILYEWDVSRVDFRYISGDKDMDNDVCVQRIKHFCDCVNVKHLKNATIKKFVNSGYRNISDVVNMSLDEIAGVEGIGKKTACNISLTLTENVRKADMHMLMAGSGVFDKNGTIGIKKLQMLVNTFSELQLRECDRDSLFKTRVAKLSGLSIDTANTIAENLPAFFAFYDSIKALRQTSL